MEIPIPVDSMNWSLSSKPVVRWLPPPLCSFHRLSLSFKLTGRKEARVGTHREDIPACVQTFGLGIHFPQPLPTTAEVSAGETTDDILLLLTVVGNIPLNLRIEDVAVVSQERQPGYQAFLSATRMLAMCIQSRTPRHHVGL
eukprot:369604-Amphidinium_carterae.1